MIGGAREGKAAGAASTAYLVRALSEARSSCCASKRSAQQLLCHAWHFDLLAMSHNPS
jgi:hypothetical protein